MTKSGTIGRVAVVNTSEPFSLFVSVALLKPAAIEVLTGWVSVAFRAWLQTINVDSDVKGSAIKNLHLEVMRVLAVPLSPLAEQRRIVAAVQRQLATVERIEAVAAANLRRCERMREAVLAKAFRGELV